MPSNTPKDALISKLRAEVRSLKKELADFQAAHEHSVDLMVENAQLKKSIGEAVATLDDVRNKLSKARKP